MNVNIKKNILYIKLGIISHCLILWKNYLILVNIISLSEKFVKTNWVVFVVIIIIKCGFVYIPKHCTINENMLTVDYFKNWLINVDLLNCYFEILFF